MKNIGVLRRHIPTGAIIWFPSGFTFEGMVGIVLSATQPYGIGFTFAYWDYQELKETDYELEINLIPKQ
jgi:hypothetical protein